MSAFDLPADLLKGRTAARRTARVDSLGERMTQHPSETAPPAAPGADTPTRTTGAWQPPADVGPRSFRTPSEKTTQRQNVDLNPGMKARLIKGIGGTRAAFAEAHVCGDRRQELILDLMKARRALSDLEADGVKRVWLHNQDRAATDPAYLQELAKRRQRVEGLTKALEVVEAQQHAAHLRGCALRSLVGKIARPLRVRPGQVVPPGWSEDDVDLDAVEERLYESS